MLLFFKGSITGGQEYQFFVPGVVDYNSASGATLEVYAIGGNKVLETRIKSNPQCIHVRRHIFLMFSKFEFN